MSGRRRSSAQEDSLSRKLIAICWTHHSSSGCSMARTKCAPLLAHYQRTGRCRESERLKKTCAVCKCCSCQVQTQCQSTPKRLPCSLHYCSVTSRKARVQLPGVTRKRSKKRGRICSRSGLQKKDKDKAVLPKIRADELKTAAVLVLFEANSFSTLLT